MWSIGDLRRGVGVDRVGYDHTCSTHRNTSKLKTISRVPIPFVRHSQKQSRVGLKLIGPDEVAHNNVAEHRALNGEPGGDSVLGGAPEAERNLPVTEFPDQWFPRLRMEFVMNLALHGQQVFAKAYGAAVRKRGEIPQGFRVNLAPGLLLCHDHPGSKLRDG
jgi:hypothetical protein